MAIMQTSGRNSEALFRLEDEAWLQGVLDMIPQTVYGDDPSHTGLKEDSAKGVQKNVKRKSSEKKRRAKKGQAKESGDDNDTRHASLKKKLHDKILEKRTERKADDESCVVARAERKRKRDEKTLSAGGEGKRPRTDKKKQVDGKGKGEKVATKDSEDGEGRENRKRKAEGNDEDGKSVALETTRIEGFKTEKARRKVKSRKLRGSKLAELQKQLEEVTRQKEVEQKVSDTSGGGDATVNEGREREMEKAMQRAQGIDVKDDAKKLKKSIRKEKRKTEKSREEWAKRKKTQEMEQKAKQDKRVRNLEERKEKRGSTKKSKAGVGKKK